MGNGFFTNGAPGQNLAGLVDNFIPANGSNGKIKQYSLELSNVDLTNGASMISHQRSFRQVLSGYDFGRNLTRGN